MGTALIYVVVVVVVAAVFFVSAALLFGRGEELAPIPPGASPTWLPEESLGADSVRALRFQQAVRGYKMAEVDWALQRLADELERRGADEAVLRERIAELEARASDDRVEEDAR